MIITRFAPSPTGNLHIGGLRTALFNYLHARSKGGKFLLRIEDTDLARNCVDAQAGILQAFKWVGLDYDGEVTYQSKRFDIYKTYIQKLLDSKKAYYCYMSKDELDAIREEMRQKGQTPRYNRKYRDFDGEPPSGVMPVVRIKAPLEGEIVFDDGIKGRVVTSANELDDFIIARSDGTPIYNFTVVVDDALMGITDVIRGDDHLSNTPKQIILYNALGFDIPRFFHIPMICNENGKKLSKRDGAMGVMDYAHKGFLPEALLNFLVRLGWSYGDDEIFSIETLRDIFDANHINASPSSFNYSKLLWLNHHYMNKHSDESIHQLLKDLGFDMNPALIPILFPPLRERAKTLLEFKEKILDVLNSPVYDEEMFAKLATTDNAHSLQHARDIIKKLDFDMDIQDLEQHFNKNIESLIKPSKLLLPLRLALLGKTGGIPIFTAMKAIGQQETLKRIDGFVSTIVQSQS